MTMAHKCDRCNILYEDAPGIVSVDYHIGEPDEKHGLVFSGVEDFELCLTCAAEFLLFVKHETTP